MRGPPPLVTPALDLEAPNDSALEIPLGRRVGMRVGGRAARMPQVAADETADADPCLVRVCVASGWVYTAWFSSIPTAFAPASSWRTMAHPCRCRTTRRCSGGVACGMKCFRRRSSSQSRAATRACSLLGSLLATCAVWSCCTSPQGESSCAWAKTHSSGQPSLARRVCTQLVATACVHEPTFFIDGCCTGLRLLTAGRKAG